MPINHAVKKRRELEGGASSSLPFGFKVSVSNLLMLLFCASSVLGYVVSFGKLYLFHVVVVVLLLSMFTGYIKIYKSAVKQTVPLLLFIAYASLSLLWAPNVKNGLYFLFYFANAFVIVFVLINYSQALSELNFVFKVLAWFFSLNILIALLETTGYFRLPASPYYGVSHTRPSGFDFNLNNFGFVFLAVLPFLFLYPASLAKWGASLLAVWFAFKLESKGFFLGLVSFYCFYFIVEVKKKSTWRWLAGLGLLVLLAGIFLVAFTGSLNVNNRMFSAFGQIERGMQLIQSKNIDAQDSTSTRSFMYLYGVQEFTKTYGVGLGAAGIGSKLAVHTDIFETDKEFFSFHNFFLEMLLDFGIFVFALLMFAYFRLIIKLNKVSKKMLNERLGYYAKASVLSLLTILPASISPSSIIYVFTFWLVIGFSMAVLNLTRKHNDI